MRGRTPASRSGAIRSMSRSGTPARSSLTCDRTSAGRASVEPWSRKRTCSSPQRASSALLTMPLRDATRAKCIPLEPAIRVRSRSKKAAALLIGPRAAPAGALLRAVDLKHDRVPLTAAGADRRASKATATATQLVHQRSNDPRTGRSDGVAERDGTAVDVHLFVVDAEHAHRVDGHGG